MHHRVPETDRMPSHLSKEARHEETAPALRRRDMGIRRCKIVGAEGAKGIKQTGGNPLRHPFARVPSNIRTCCAKLHAKKVGSALFVVQ